MATWRLTVFVCSLLVCAAYLARSTTSSCRSPPGAGQLAADSCHTPGRDMFPFGPIIRQAAQGRHTGSVILLHGLGDTGDGAHSL